MHGQVLSRPVALLAALAAGCTIYTDPNMAEGTIFSTGAKPGYGTIESVGVLRNARRNAPAQSTAAAGDPHGYRLFLRMDAGTQFVDVDNSTFMPGEAVEVTADGRVRRISGTSLMVK